VIDDRAMLETVKKAQRQVDTGSAQGEEEKKITANNVRWQRDRGENGREREGKKQHDILDRKVLLLRKARSNAMNEYRNRGRRKKVEPNRQFKNAKNSFQNEEVVF